jgi:hypothetical protein
MDKKDRKLGEATRGAGVSQGGRRPWGWRRLTLIALVGWVALGGAGDAYANSHQVLSVSRTPTELKVSVLLRPNYRPIARIGIGRVGVPADRLTRVTASPDAKKRALAAGLSKGLLLAKFHEVTGLKANEPKQVDLVFPLADHPRLERYLRTSQEINILTAWRNETPYTLTWSEKTKGGKTREFKMPYWHVHGLWDGPTGAKDPAFVVKLDSNPTSPPPLAPSPPPAP